MAGQVKQQVGKCRERRVEDFLHSGLFRVEESEVGPCFGEFRCSGVSAGQQ